jgi:hypothetical protein
MSSSYKAAVQFRGKVFTGDYHCDALHDCIECPDWTESHEEIERILDNEIEPWAFGYAYPSKGFVPMLPQDAEIRRDWYIKPNPSIWRNLFGR